MSNESVRAEDVKDGEVASARDKLLAGFIFITPLLLVPLLTLLFMG